MKDSIFLSVLLACALTLSELTFAGPFTDERDPLVQTFSQAKGQAIQHLSSFKSCSLDAEPAQSKAWIQSRLQSLIQDIASSPHHWYTDLQPTCAFTQATFASPINFSYAACKPHQGNQMKAIEILMKESVHHQGITDEAYATALTTSILKADLYCDHTDHEQSAFNPVSCQGSPLNAQEIVRKMQPSETVLNAMIPNHYFKRRYRDCNELTGCAKWTVKNLLEEHYVYCGNCGSNKIGSYIIPKASFQLVAAAPLRVDLNFNSGLSNGSYEFLRFGLADVSAPSAKPYIGLTLVYAKVIPSYFADSGRNMSTLAMNSTAWTSQCFFWKSSFKTEKAANGSWKEEDYAMGGKLQF